LELPKLGDYPEKYLKLAALLTRMVGSEPPDPNEPWAPPFLLDRPTMHASRSDFEAELAVASELSKGINSILKLYEDDARLDALGSLRELLDEAARQDYGPTPHSSPNEIVEIVMRHAGVMSTTLIGLTITALELRKRLGALEEEKRVLRGGAHKPSDLHARALALRLAKFYASQTGLRPTSRTTDRSRGATTSFALALDELFDLVDIDTGTRSPMGWAIRNIEDDDLLPPHENLVRVLSSGGNAEQQDQDKAHQEMMRALLWTS
tara:strand:- start:104 stop:898 length:795 start_codon:yes stop_codon:yes gene_type:complete